MKNYKEEKKTFFKRLLKSIKNDILNQLENYAQKKLFLDKIKNALQEP